MSSTAWVALAITLTSAAAAAAEPPLTLDEALRLTRANHPQLQAVRAQTEAAAARVEVAKAPLLPQVTGTGWYQRSSRHASTPTLVVGSSTPTATVGTASSDLYSFGLTASQLIYDFGQTTGRWDAAKASLQAVQQTELRYVAQLAFNLRAAFYAAAAARAQLAVAEENLRNQEAHLRQIQGFVEAGTRPEIDLAQSRTDRANAQVQLINANVTYDTNKALLNQAMGVERGTEYDIVEPPVAVVVGEDGTTDALLPSALTARPDLQALARQIEAQELTTASLKGGYGPSLSASTGLTESGPRLDELRWGWFGRLSLNWQLFGGFITRQQVGEARANIAGLRAQYELGRQQVRADVEQARLGVRAAKAAIAASHEAAVNARVRLTLAEGRYQAGVGNAIELGDAQLAYTSAAAQEVQARFNLATARARLLLALGQP